MTPAASPAARRLYLSGHGPRRRALKKGKPILTTLIRVRDAAGFLASLAEAKRFLAACSNIDEAKVIRDKADAVRVWARAQKDAGDLEVAAGELRVLATVRMGELLPPKPTREELSRMGGEGKARASAGSSREPAEPPPKPYTTCTPCTPYVSRKDVHTARALAAVPEPVRAAVIADAKAKGEAPTIAAVLRAGREAERAQAAEERRKVATPETPLTTSDLAALAASGRRFATIYADPPWSYANQGTTGTMANHYDGMPLEAICAMPVPALAEENAHLHLWATSPLLPEAFTVMKAWGFTYRSMLVWNKTGRIGMGNYWRVCHEFLLLGVRGRLPFPDDAHGIRSVVDHDVLEHSAKPDVFRGLVERVSPGPRIELFGRESGALAPGWVVWGNQIPRTLFARALGGAS